MFTLNGRCNLRCLHCPRGVYDVKSHPTPPEIVDLVIREVLPHVRAVRLGGTDLGEQLLAPDFERFMEAVIANPDVQLEITTNLTVLSDHAAELIARGCDELAISLEGVGSAYERIRGFPWSTVKGNIEKLVAARARAPQRRLAILALVTCFYDNLEDLEDVLSLADLGVDFFRFRTFFANTPEQDGQMLHHHPRAANRALRRLRRKAAARGLDVSLPDDLPNGRGRRGRPAQLSSTTSPDVRRLFERRGVAWGSAPAAPAARGFSARFSDFADKAARLFEGLMPAGLPAAVEAAPSRATKPKIPACHFPFEVVSILADGTVGTCCENIRLGALQGDAGELTTLWRGEEWTRLRRAVAEHRYEGACTTCSFRRDSIMELGDRASVVDG